MIHLLWQHVFYYGSWIFGALALRLLIGGYFSLVEPIPEPTPERPWDPIVDAPYDYRELFRGRFAWHVGFLLNGTRLGEITAWVVRALNQLEDSFVPDEGTDEQAQARAHWRAVERLTELLTDAWWSTTTEEPAQISEALGVLTYGAPFPVPPAGYRLRPWLYAAFDVHRLFSQEGVYACQCAGHPDYQPPTLELDALEWD